MLMSVSVLFCPFISLAQQSTERLESSDRETTLYSRAGGWFVYKAPLDCFALSEYDNSDTFSISVDLVTNRASLNLYSSRFRSIVARRQYQIQMLFRGAGRAPSLWPRQTWLGGGPGRLVLGNVNAEDIMRDISRFNTVELVTQEQAVLGSYSLRGSAAAMVSLRECERQVEADYPTDPFTGLRQ
jgi:hypothetical protein